MKSLWLDTVKTPEFEPMQGDVSTDVLIVGGGIAGLLCANFLDEAGVNYMLVEAKRICSGITHNTTAKITIQHGLIYDKLLQKHGVEKTQMYLCANQDALKRYQKLSGKIDCDFQEKSMIVYSKNKRDLIEKELSALEKLNVSASFEHDLPIQAAGAVKVNNGAQFHPLKFLYAIAKNLHVFENTKVLAFSEGVVVTDHGKIKAKKIIIATHFPMLNKHGSYFLKLYQHRSYVLGLANTPGVKNMYVDENESGMSFRNYGNLLLLGGGGHRTGKKGGGWNELMSFAKEHYPGAREMYRFATQDCMTLDGIPYIGQYSSRTPNLYVATGFQKWGMTNAMAAAVILRDLVLEQANPYAEVFSPSRSILRKQLFVNAGEAAVNLLTPSVPRCPHMGCALKYNQQENSWDCPCHGSRFTEDGKLIDNPATDDK